MKPAAIGFGLALALFSSVAVGGESPCEIPEGVKLTQRDSGRLGGLEISRTLGLAAALRTLDANSREIIASLFEKGFDPIVRPEELIGDYQCRTIKLGGLGPSIIYDWFSCEIFPEEAALLLTKTSGSQRFFGRLFTAGAGLAYRGASHYGYENEIRFYGDEADRDQVGCLSNIAGERGHLILELPEPVFESQHDVIELVRLK